MNEKISVLMTVCHIVEVESDELDKDFGILDKLDYELSKDKELVVEGSSFYLEWVSNSRIVLDPESHNCGRCAVCNSWVTDVDQPNRIEGLGYGARVDGKLLCDEHLPIDHPHAF